MLEIGYVELVLPLKTGILVGVHVENEVDPYIVLGTEVAIGRAGSRFKVVGFKFWPDRRDFDLLLEGPARGLGVRDPVFLQPEQIAAKAS